jgi:hypothetical protein
MEIRFRLLLQAAMAWLLQQRYSSETEKQDQTVWMIQDINRIIYC